MLMDLCSLMFSEQISRRFYAGIAEAPSNILLSSKKKPKLCDFGLAIWTTAPSIPFLCKTVKGTFGYLALEYF
ncbi:unnamed protein product [Ilex paraguariensis]|uniref:Protein kinase domain-containing protein n=1 Tax=Ilex paraguariensis TaxID=185542 RepID=A0ABC8T970_9AQUA